MCLNIIIYCFLSRYFLSRCFKKMLKIGTRKHQEQLKTGKNQEQYLESLKIRGVLRAVALVVLALTSRVVF